MTVLRHTGTMPARRAPDEGTEKFERVVAVQQGAEWKQFPIEPFEKGIFGENFLAVVPSDIEFSCRSRIVTLGKIWMPIGRTKLAEITITPMHCP